MKALMVILPILGRFAMLAEFACNLDYILTQIKRDKQELPGPLVAGIKYNYQLSPAKTQTAFELTWIFVMIWLILEAISYVLATSSYC